MTASRSMPEAAAPPKPSSPAPFAEASREAKLLAAAILEVLAGSQGPSEAAHSLGISLARYYQLEARALAGLVSSCEARRRGARRARNELTALQRECEQLRRECARQQALARATRRTVGLAAADAPPVQSGPKRRRRSPAVRALKMAALLHEQTANAVATAPQAHPKRDDGLNGGPIAAAAQENGS